MPPAYLLYLRNMAPPKLLWDPIQIKDFKDIIVYAWTAQDALLHIASMPITVRNVVYLDLLDYLTRDKKTSKALKFVGAKSLVVYEKCMLKAVLPL